MYVDFAVGLIMELRIFADKKKRRVATLRSLRIKQEMRLAKKKECKYPVSFNEQLKKIAEKLKK